MYIQHPLCNRIIVLADLDNFIVRIPANLGVFILVATEAAFRTLGVGLCVFVGGEKPHMIFKYTVIPGHSTIMGNGIANVLAKSNQSK